MVKRSIEQDTRNKNFGTRNGNYEKKRHGQESGDKNSVYKEFLEIVGNGSPTGSVLEETLFTQTSTLLIRKLCCMCLKTTKQWSRWLWREGPKNPIKYIDTKNQLADILTKGKSTRYEWNHLLWLSNISHFSSTVFSEVMSKRTQKDSGEERVTAKSKPMMNLVFRCSETTPDVLASAASESPGNTREESQLPLSSWNEQHQRTGRPGLDAYSSNYSEWTADKNWSSQEWKSDELLDDRTEEQGDLFW